MSWYILVWKRAFDFATRSRRKEYWMFFLFNLIIALVLTIIDAMVFGRGTPEEPSMGVLSLIYSLAIFIPSIAVTIRRLHDIGRSGWWFLVAFIPFVGFIILLIFMARDSEEGTNDWGPNPKADET